MTIYGLIGNPLIHSFSAAFFNDKFGREGVDASYRNFELHEIDELMELLAEYPNIGGLNVTIPYKQQVLPYCTALSPQAQSIGAVNTLRLLRNSEGELTGIEGHNTDCPAFARTLAPLLPLEPISALVLGSGGASKAVLAALSLLGIPATTVSRTAKPGALTYDDLTPAVMAANRLIINCTPLGTFPHVDTCPQLPYDLITAAHICYDLVYNPAETLFMRLSAQRGATVKNGADMLRLQALLAYSIWL